VVDLPELVGFLVLAGFVLLLVVRNWPEKGTPVGEVGGATIAGDEVVLLVSGLSEAELSRILAEFSDLYDLPADSFRVIEKGEPATQIRISQSIDPVVLTFLVNYLQYPKDLSLDNLSLEDREVAVIAVVERSEVLGGPSELAGRRATIYVPAEDTEGDLVFVRVDPARYFRITFTRMQWRPVDDGREPQAVRDLARGVAF
jgi:hypothetical protein